MSLRPAELQLNAYDTVQDAEMLSLLYRTEQRYGWSVGMRAITTALLRGAAIPDGPVLELGCGGGHMLSELQDTYPGQPMVGVDLHPQALAYARAAVGSKVRLAQGHLYDVPFPAGAFALCLALDAFDQRNVELEEALAESNRVLKPHGILLLRVSAHPWLQGPHDEAFNTGRRYHEQDMLRALDGAGFEPLRITYANTLLSGPVGALRLLQRWRVVPFMPSLYTTRALNKLLAVALQCEARWLKVGNLPGGMSLFIVARKTNQE